MKLLEPTLESIPIARPKPTRKHPQGLCLDRAYDSAGARGTAISHGFTPAHPHPRRGDRARRFTPPAGVPGAGSSRRAHSWLNRNRGILIRWSKKDENHLALLQLASGLIAFKKAHHTTTQTG